MLALRPLRQRTAHFGALKFGRWRTPRNTQGGSQREYIQLMLSVCVVSRPAPATCDFRVIRGAGALDNSGKGSRAGRDRKYKGKDSSPELNT